MITLHRSQQRHTLRGRGRKAWQTFWKPARSSAKRPAFAAIEGFDEVELSARASLTVRSTRPIDLITYLFEGTLAHDDGEGHSDVLHAGEFSRASIARHSRYGETNPSTTGSARLFHLRLPSFATAGDPSSEHRRFSAAQRRGVLCPVAAPRGRNGTLTIQHDAVIYSALLESGQHIVHELGAGCSAWLHLVHGELLIGDLLLSTGDGVGITAERGLSFTSRASSEILLVSLGPAASRGSKLSK